MKVKKLKFKVAKDIFYNVLNICYNFTYNSWFYCCCRKFCGCQLQNRERSYCFICQIRNGYDIQEIEKIQKISTINDVYQNLKNDIKKFIEFEPQLDHFRCPRYKTTWRLYGNTGQAYLKNYFENYLNILAYNM